MEQAAQRLGWMGQDRAHVLSTRVFLTAQQGDTAAATERLERSVALLETGIAELDLGAIYEQTGRLERAAALAPGDEEIRRDLALARSAPEVGATGRGAQAGES